MFKYVKTFIFSVLGCSLSLAAEPEGSHEIQAQSNQVVEQATPEVQHVAEQPAAETHVVEQAAPEVQHVAEQPAAETHVVEQAAPEVQHVAEQPAAETHVVEQAAPEVQHVAEQPAAETHVALHTAQPQHSLTLPHHNRKFALKYDSDNHTQSLNWLKKRNLVSNNKHLFSGDHLTLAASADIRQFCPSVYDQGQLGSCTANAIAGAIQTDYIRLNKANFTPSRLFIYYYERMLEGTIKEDSGASISDGLRVICTYGSPRENLWPYNDGPTQFIKTPSKSAFKDAKKHKDLDNRNLASVNQDLATIKSVLATNIPIVFGIDVYDSFMSDDVATSGIVPMPNTATETLLGGHAVMLVGYDDNTQTFIVRNSWGSGWGQGGYFTLPYAYVTSTDLADDFWKINNVS